jgi:hypothetical protein
VGLLDKLLGKAKGSGNPYLDAGMALTAKLVNSLGLDDWKNRPVCYTAEETNAIESDFASFASSVNRKMGGPEGGRAAFHPDIADDLRRVLAATALEQLAGGDWKYLSDKLPDNWKSRCSTYLKAWACKPNPSAIEDLAKLLIRAGYKSEASDSLRVLLLFPSYAHTYFGGKDGDRKLTNLVVENARQTLRTLATK